MKNLTNFNTIGDYNTEVGEEILSQPNVSLIQDSGKVIFSNTLPPYEEQYLTFIPLEDGQFSFRNISGASVSYSLDYGTTWVTLPNNTNTPTIEAGHKVFWKATELPTRYNGTYNLLSDYGCGFFASTCEFNVEGNVTSMMWGDNFNDEVYYQSDKKYHKKYYSISKNFYFNSLFMNCSNLIDASNLKLPFGTESGNTSYSSVGAGIYSYMFKGCTKLTAAPQLLASRCNTYCYFHMFENCSSLVTAPTIASLNVNNKPESYAYNNMFYGCTNLSENIPTSLPYMWAKDNDGDSEACYASMFSNCTSLTTAPILPSLHIPSAGYGAMFQGCTSLNYVKAMFVTPIVNNQIDAYHNVYTRSWLDNVSNSGTFVKNASATWSVSGANGIPNGWTVQTASN